MKKTQFSLPMSIQRNISATGQDREPLPGLPRGLLLRKRKMAALRLKIETLAQQVNNSCDVMMKAKRVSSSPQSFTDMHAEKVASWRSEGMKLIAELETLKAVTCVEQKLLF